MDSGSRTDNKLSYRKHITRQWQWLNGIAATINININLDVIGRPCRSQSGQRSQEDILPISAVDVRTHGLELSPGFHPGLDIKCRLFQTFA